jgi:hypothetical protein
MGSGLTLRRNSTKGGVDGYPNVCRTRRKDATDTGQQREVETLWPAGDQRRTIFFSGPVDLKFDK